MLWIYSQIWEPKGKFFSPFLSEGLRIILTRNIGLGPGVTNRLLSRPIHTFRRIEEFISGFVDSLWIADQTIFCRHRSDYKIIRTIVRKIFKVGTYDLLALVTMWKEWGNHLFHTAARTVTIGQLKVPHQNNIFNRLRKIKWVDEIYSEMPTQLSLQRISHLVYLVIHSYTSQNLAHA